jgi:3-methyladenine DNA glycosylase AlkC
MPEPLKTFFSPALVRRLAADIERVEPSFPSSAFVRDATAGLERLELLARGKHIARALASHLPEDYPSAIDVLLRSLGQRYDSLAPAPAGMAPFYYLPHTLFVAERGLGHFELSLDAQYELTKRFSAEFSIRPFIGSDPERTFARLVVWARDEDPRVRRLVSEGTRLRLPWAQRVAWLDANPRRVIELLELLKDDDTSLVRRSVANNLNDLGRVHPELVIETCRRWSAGAGPEREKLLRHALRSLIKKAHPGALALLGAGRRAAVEVTSVELSEKVVRLGTTLRFSFRVQSSAGRAERLLVDFRVHFVKANGSLRPKTFKLKELVLGANGSAELSGRVSFAQMSTRRHYPGRHRLEALINGATHPLGEFDVRA